jgi:hypothetical protein
MDPERKVPWGTLVVCGFGALILYVMGHPSSFETPLPSLTEQPKTESAKPPGSGWYARIYCALRTPTCGVNDGTIIEIPVDAISSKAPISERDQCEAFARLAVMYVNEHAMVTIDCIQTREAFERKAAESKPVQKPAQKPLQPPLSLTPDAKTTNR